MDSGIDKLNDVLKYIFSIKGEIRITLCISGGCKVHYNIPRKLTREKRKLYMEKIYNALDGALHETSTVLIRYQENNEDVFHICGLVFMDGDIYLVDKHTLQMCMSVSPNGALDIWDDEVYEEADIPSCKIISN